MNLNPSPKIEQQNKTGSNALEIKRAEYLDLVNDMGMLLGLNASRLDQQIVSGKEKELAELQATLRSPVIDQLNYADFMAKYGAKLTDPTISKKLIAQIYNFLVYIEPRLTIFKEDSAWKKRFYDIKAKYTKIVSKV